MPIFEKLSRPEYLHVLLNPIPLYGLALGALALIIALFLRSRPARFVAFVLIIITALSAWPVFHYGDEAYGRVKPLSDEAGVQWLNEHMWRAEKTIALFFIVAAVALAALLLPSKWPRTDFPLTIATLVVAIGALAAASWISFAGGQVRHPEFRSRPPAESR